MLIWTPADAGRGGAGGAAVRSERTSEEFVESAARERARVARRQSPDVLFLSPPHDPPAPVADEEWSALDQPAPPPRAAAPQPSLPRPPSRKPTATK
jgi:hypothetical protein